MAANVASPESSTPDPPPSNSDFSTYSVSESSLSESSSSESSSSETQTEASEPRTFASFESDQGGNSVNSVPILPRRMSLGNFSIASARTYSSAGDFMDEECYIPFRDNISANRAIDNMPAPGTKSHLPCPFNWCGCDIRYDIRERQKWIFHSLDHFGAVAPPEAVQCTFEHCKATFREPNNKNNNLGNWSKRMEHFADHIKEKLVQLREWNLRVAGSDDEDLIARELLDVSESVDVNFRQYAIRHRIADRIGLDMVINPNPRSELDHIPSAMINRMPEEYGGRRTREVVLGSPGAPEKYTDSRSAYTYAVRDSRRNGGGAVKAWAAKTSGNATRPRSTYIRPGPLWSDQTTPGNQTIHGRERRERERIIRINRV